MYFYSFLVIPQSAFVGNPLSYLDSTFMTTLTAR